MALASLYKVHRVLLNLSFILLLCILTFHPFSSSIQSNSISNPPHTVFRLRSSSPPDPNDYREIEALVGSETKCSNLNKDNPSENGGYIDYLIIFYCVFGDSPVLGYILLVLWLLILFYLLGNTASQYFCPSLESLSQVLKLSPTIAGITLLSLGNGASDVFASIVSFSAGGGSGKVGLSSVLGGAFFVSSAVSGVISIRISSTSGHAVVVDRVGFIRDIIFLLIILSFLLLILALGEIHIMGSLLYVSLYILYVVVVSMTHCCRKQLGELGVPLLESIEIDQGQSNEEVEEFKSKLTSFNSEASVPCYLKWMIFLIELPLFIPRRLTIPVVTEERWSKPFAVASVSLSPILLATLWISQREELGSDSSITIFLFAVLVGVILGIIAIEGTESSHPPKFLLPWLAGGFLMSVVWTYIVASELVSLLVSIGHIVGVSPSVLGVTVLAWGNSIGDLISNVTMAVNGGEDGVQIAIAGCYAGPIFNTLVGLGLSLVFSSWSSYPLAFVIPEDPSQFLIIGFLIGGLLWALLMLPRKGMRLNRVLGVGLLAIYSCFLCLRLLESMEVLQLGVS